MNFLWVVVPQLQARGEMRGEGKSCQSLGVQTKTEFETMKFAEENNDEEEIPT